MYTAEPLSILLATFCSTLELCSSSRSQPRSRLYVCLFRIVFDVWRKPGYVWSSLYYHLSNTLSSSYYISRIGRFLMLSIYFTFNILLYIFYPRIELIICCSSCLRKYRALYKHCVLQINWVLISYKHNYSFKNFY